MMIDGYTIGEFVNDLKRFNPNARIMNTINISWSADDCDDVNDSKITTDKVWIFDETYNKEMDDEG